MTDLGTYLAKNGSHLASDEPPTGPPLIAWLKKGRATGERLMVPDMATLDTSGRSDRLHRIEADLMVRHRIGRGTQVQGVRIMVAAAPSRDGWWIESIDIHAPVRCFSDTTGWDVSALAAAGMTENLPWCATLPIIDAVNDAMRDEVMTACQPSAAVLCDVTQGRITEAWLAGDRDKVTGKIDGWRVEAMLYVHVANRQLMAQVVVHGTLVDNRPTISRIVAA